MASKSSSSRKRKLETIRRSNFKVPGHQYWIRKEKQALLSGLKKFGGYDLNKLADVVKTKSAPEIKHFIEGRRRQHGVCSAHTRASIELWLDKAQKYLSHKCDYSVGLAEAVSGCIQNGYQDVYQFIIHLLKCEFPPELDDCSGSVLHALLHDLACLIKSLNLEELKTYIKECQGSEPGISTNNDDLSDDATFKFYNEGITPDGEDLDSFNPLKLPTGLLRNTYLNAKEKLKTLIETTE